MGTEFSGTNSKIYNVRVNKDTIHVEIHCWNSKAA
ncbi:Uncharacterised protein [Vibrio cholerae]|nr:Uncharacterised protein [Vibrio cholerae]